MGIPNQRRRYVMTSLTALCILISWLRYLQHGDIPLLNITIGQIPWPSWSSPVKNTLEKQFLQECTCVCPQAINSTTSNGEEPRRVIPYIAPGPSKIQELVPMKTLKKSISLDEYEGLVNLDHTSLSHYFLCHPLRSWVNKGVSVNQKQCRKRRFLNQKSPITALVSFHGSGNTWVRHLLEQATGIFSGSIYCDPVLKAMFPGESVASGNVVVVKTHHADTRDLPKDVQLEMNKEKYDRAIVLVRDPFDALVSEANRRWNGNHTVNSHVGLAEETAFVGNSKWDWLVEYKGATWSYLLHTWLVQTEIPIHVVQYEQLVKNTQQELMKMINFLEIEVTEEEIDCAVKNGEGPFKRAAHLNFDPFSSLNKEAVNRCIAQAMPLLVKHGIHYEQR